MPTADLTPDRHPMTVRLPLLLATQVAFAARARGESMNVFAIRALQNELDRVAADPRLVAAAASVAGMTQVPSTPEG